MDNIINKIILNFNELYIDNTLTAIKVTGTDNKKFLQGQLTNDIESITDNYLNASYCTHQGKVIVNMQVILIDSDVVLLLSKSLAEYFIEKISKYILMSDVQFTKYDHINIYWALGERASYMLTKYDIKKTESNNKINKSEYLINMSTKNSYKCRYISLDSKVCENINFASLEQSQTCLLDLLSLHTRLKKDDIEKYIPQVLNSDELNTVSYKKGCYTGQEVIARTHYLGNVKKHLYLVTTDTCIDSEVNIVNTDGESVGELIGETFKHDNKLLSHGILRDSSDFKDLFIANRELKVIAKEDIV